MQLSYYVSGALYLAGKAKIGPKNDYKIKDSNTKPDLTAVPLAYVACQTHTISRAGCSYRPLFAILLAGWLGSYKLGTSHLFDSYSAFLPLCLCPSGCN